MLENGRKERWPFSSMVVGEVVVIMGEKGMRGSFVCKAKGMRFKYRKFYTDDGGFGYRFERVS